MTYMEKFKEIFGFYPEANPSDEVCNYMCCDVLDYKDSCIGCRHSISKLDPDSRATWSDEYNGIENKLEKVSVVSYYNDNQLPQIKVFDNYLAAKNCYNHYGDGKYKYCYINEVPVYNTFMISKEPNLETKDDTLNNNTDDDLEYDEEDIDIDSDAYSEGFKDGVKHIMNLMTSSVNDILNN